ncbi:RNA-directed DNA polymerase, eukaryota, partial [Tanacetum coccineum]
ERSVSREEIRLAVWNCGENKSPGPDGYTFEFFRKYWNIVGPDLCEVVEYFFETCLFPKGCNSSFVALIPKVADAKSVNDFRPISLIGSVYKVVTKVLANRLALVIEDLVSDTQSAFVANRQILDGPFILNEILHWCKRKKKQAMFFKVDFAKAYDSVSWDYLLDVLEAFGVGQTLYALESSKDVTVSSKIGDTSLVRSFRRIPRGGIEQNQFDNLVELVRSVTIVPSDDRWNWNLESTGIFSVASARRRIDEICLPNIV